MFWSTASGGEGINSNQQLREDAVRRTGVSLKAGLSLTDGALRVLKEFDQPPISMLLPDGRTFQARCAVDIYCCDGMSKCRVAF